MWLGSCVGSVVAIGSVLSCSCSSSVGRTGTVTVVAVVVSSSGVVPECVVSVVPDCCSVDDSAIAVSSAVYDGDEGPWSWCELVDDCPVCAPLGYHRWAGDGVDVCYLCLSRDYLSVSVVLFVDVVACHGGVLGLTG